MLDLDIARFTATKRVSVSGSKNTVQISLAVTNSGEIDVPWPATVIGMQGATEVYGGTPDVLVGGEEGAGRPGATEGSCEEGQLPPVLQNKGERDCEEDSELYGRLVSIISS